MGGIPNERNWQSTMNHWLRSLLFRTPILGRKIRSWHAAFELGDQLSLGGYYSPIASEISIAKHARIDLQRRDPVRRDAMGLDGIEVRVDRQIEFLQRLESENRFALGWIKRYQRGNDFFQHMDAMMLHAMISTHRPRRIVEIGSGFSTLAILDSLDANQLTETTLTLIEPHPERLFSCVSTEDRERFELLQRPLSMDDVERCASLQANDLLLVDSSHVYKVGSDVQILFETIYPRLGRDVLLHIHDVFFPFEYPASWMTRGHHFNEAYVLRAFLQFNRSFEIVFWNDLIKHLADYSVPDSLHCPANDLSTSIWLRKCD